MCNPGTTSPSDDPLALLAAPAPAWARRLAEQAIRDRDVVPVETWPDTPRGSEGGNEDLAERTREAEWVVRAGEAGMVSKRDWVHYGEHFDSLPGVGQYFRYLLERLPHRPYRQTVPSRRKRHGPKKAKGGRVELAPAVEEGLSRMSWGIRLLAFA